MLIDVGALKGETGGSKAFEGVEEVKSPSEEVDIGEVRVEGVCTNTGDAILVSGTVKAEVRLPCSRCLAPYSITLEREFVEQFVEGEEGGDDFRPFSGDSIEIHDIIEEAVLLGLPMKAVCSPDCRGLCPVCGADLNYESCDCERDDIDPRLAVLAKLKGVD